jgi:hypothetical protein
MEAHLTGGHMAGIFQVETTLAGHLAIIEAAVQSMGERCRAGEKEAELRAVVDEAAAKVGAVAVVVADTSEAEGTRAVADIAAAAEAIVNQINYSKARSRNS